MRRSGHECHALRVAYYTIRGDTQQKTRKSVPSGTGPRWPALPCTEPRPNTEDGASLAAEEGVAPPPHPAAWPSMECAGDERRDCRTTCGRHISRLQFASRLHKWRLQHQEAQSSMNAASCASPACSAMTHQGVERDVLQHGVEYLQQRIAGGALHVARVGAHRHVEDGPYGLRDEAVCVVNGWRGQMTAGPAWWWARCILKCHAACTMLA